MPSMCLFGVFGETHARGRCSYPVNWDLKPVSTTNTIHIDCLCSHFHLQERNSYPSKSIARTAKYERHYLVKLHLC